MSFSEGEKKRMDIAILLSFIDITKTLTNWNCNVILFDEVLDNATDAEGLEKILNSIKTITKKNEKLCSYIISHRDIDSELYDKKIQIRKVSGFSRIKND
jgi:Fe-S cluster assembly ATPase SufC